jgi:site-specific DNA recombinase
MPGKFQPIISADLYKVVQACLSGKPAEQKRTKENPDFPLRLFARCEACETGLTGSFSTGRKEKYPYYFCRVPSCRAVKFRRDDLHVRFIGMLESLQPSPEYSALFREVLKSVLHEKREENAGRLAQVKKPINELEHRKQQLVDALLNQKIDQKVYDDQMLRVGTALDAAILETLNILPEETELQRLS